MFIVLLTTLIAVQAGAAPKLKLSRQRGGAGSEALRPDDRQRGMIS